MSARRTRWLPLALAAAGACAHVEPPPGGPEDTIAPRVSFMQPESLSVVPGFTSPVIIRFDERISEQGANEAVSVSPRTSTVNIDRGREGIRVSLREGWEPGVIYHVTVNREVRDLFNNRLEEPISVVFSTGPPIPETRVGGTVVDRLTGRPSADSRVEAVRTVDSLVYAVPTDSAGSFHIAHIPTGSYLLRAFRDANRNRALDSYEPRDTTRIEVGGDAGDSIRLAIVDPDSTAPKLASATPAAGGGVELKFDDYLDPAQELDSTFVTIADSAGVPRSVTQVTFAPPARADSAAAPARPPAPTAPAPGAAPAARPLAAAPEPTGPLPSQTLYVQVAAETPLAPGTTYRVTVRSIRNVVGLAGESSAPLTVPAARPPAAPPAPPAAP